VNLNIKRYINNQYSTSHTKEHHPKTSIILHFKSKMQSPMKKTTNTLHQNPAPLILLQI
jgi:hypothetical protein